MFYNDGKTQKPLGKIELMETDTKGFIHVATETATISKSEETKRCVQYLPEYPMIDTRDKGNIVYYYLILDYAE